MATVKELKQLSILDVAQALGMDFKRQSGNTYYWTEHDSFKINTDRNIWHWFSQDKGGDVLDFVQEIKGVSFKVAKHFLETGEFPSVVIDEKPPEPFRYLLEPYEHPDFNLGREYLKTERGLSEETINDFLKQGNLAEATRKKGDYFEPVIVFKARDGDGKVIGASLQGIVENWVQYPERGRLKQLMTRSDGLSGFSFDIGTPKRLIFLEAPIDLMSYYELHKEELENVRLVAMDGLKKGTISRYTADLLTDGRFSQERSQEVTRRAIDAILQTTDTFIDNPNLITLAVDNDESGLKFIDKLKEDNIPFSFDLPPKKEGQEKMDWNDYLKQEQRLPSTYRLEQSNLEMEKAQLEKITVSPGSRALIDSDELKQWQKHPNIYFVKGFRKVALELTDEGTFQLSARYPASSAPEKEKIERLLKQQEERNANMPKEQQKTPDRSQEYSTRGGTFNRNSDFLESELSGAASKPEVDEPLPDFPANAHLHFSISNAEKSMNKQGYHAVTPSDLKRLNRYASVIQESARYYQDELAGSRVTYFYQDNKDVKALEIDYRRESYMHLTGIFPVAPGQTSSQTLADFAKGKGDYDNILVSRGFHAKLGVLPLLPEITESKSFVLDDLSEVEKFGRLNVDKAIRSEDKDILLAFRSEDGVAFPASLLKLNHSLNLQLDTTLTDKAILGIFRQRDGITDTLSVNDNLVKDNGHVLKQVLEKGDLQRLNLADTLEELTRNKTEGVEIVQDSDADGISDKVEYGQGTDPFGANVKDTKIISETLQPELDNRSVSDMIAANDTKALAQHMKEGIKQYFDSDQYKVFLTAMSHFNNYSPRNIQLLLAQNDKVSMVASFKTWKTEFERSINKGEKALRIWAPITVTQKDPTTGIPKLDNEGNEIKVTRFKLVPVFDVSQTSGKELPKSVYELEGTHEDYANLYRAAKTVSSDRGIGFTIDPNWRYKGSGFYSPKENKIVIKGGMSEQQTLKTIFHEMAHSDLHNPENLAKTATKRSTAELQAESVAYVVANHYGLDTSEYSFAYLAGWSSDPEALSDLEEQLTVVQKEAKSLINRLDTVLEKQVTKTITQSKFIEQMNIFKKQSQERIEAKKKEREQEAMPKKSQARQELNKP